MGEERKSGEETSTWLCVRERRGNIAIKGCYQERIKEKLKRGMQGQGVKRVGIRC